MTSQCKKARNRDRRRNPKPYVVVGKEAANQVGCLHRGAPLHIIGDYLCYVKYDDRVHADCLEHFVATRAHTTPIPGRDDV